jgi:8-oxo-dGTP pyrophosphatase MutT (NUDIX family)
MSAAERNQNSPGGASDADFSIAAIARRLERHRPLRIGEEPVARAGVALLLVGDGNDPEMLLIRRATRDGDPWSGHIAFPGGRRDPDDADPVATALRETREEVGIDVGTDGEVIGHLDELRAVARHRPLDLVISPIVCALRRRVALSLDPREVESAVWVPLSFLLHPSARAVYRRTLDGVESQYPAFAYQGYTIWGLTHRIVENFLEIVRREARSPSRSAG